MLRLVGAHETPAGWARRPVGGGCCAKQLSCLLRCMSWRLHTVCWCMALPRHSGKYRGASYPAA